MAQIVSQIVLPITLAFIMLVMGLGLTKSDFIRVGRYPKAMILGLTLQLIFLPCLALFVAWLLNFSVIASLGLFLLSLCPGGATSNMFSSLAKGDVALSISLTAVTSIIVPFSLPVFFTGYLVFINSTSSQIAISEAMPVATMMKQLLLVTLLPVLIGMLIRHFFPTKTVLVQSKLKTLAAIAMFTVIILLLVTNSKTLTQSLSLTGLGTSILCVLALSLGYLIASFAKLKRAAKTTLAIEVGIQNAGTAMMLAFVVLKQPELAAVPLMYGLLMNIPACFFVSWANRSATIGTKEQIT